MAVVMKMEWPEVSPEQYDQVREIVGWEVAEAEGGIMHVAYFDEAGFKVTDVWESPEHFQSFVDNRLMPGIEQAGIEGEPKVTFTSAHRYFIPTGNRVTA